jgi:hypothetical protein
MARALDVEMLVNPDTLASTIANRWEEWKGYRVKWTQEKEELRNYIYATDTKTTTNNKNGWANSTTTPKLCQIYDNLKANYEAALFPRDKWFKFLPGSQEEATKEKASLVTSYMHEKLRLSQFRRTIDRLLDDWVQQGNCFATVDFERNYTTLETGETVNGYIGPVLVRISPYDISFDPTAVDFEATPKIVRSIKTLGELTEEAKKDENLQSLLDKMILNRSEVGSTTQYEKADGFIADGFSSIENYYQSGYVEFLTLYGNVYDTYTGKVYTNRIITVADRAYVVKNIANPSWLGTSPIFHCGWRSRPDNLYAMGPLDNLIGLQYRIDHLENLKADVFDQIATPIWKIRGDVESFEGYPGEKIILGEEGDVVPLVPDATALNADFQIQDLANKMEEMAGAPRMAMGIRTPGEKTAFEVQTLDNAANRIFNHKARKFEEEFIEPILNAMLEAARRELNIIETIPEFDEDLGVTLFQSITKEDIASDGKLIPIGARHFAEAALRTQNINQLLQIKAALPDVGSHLSGKTMAKLLAQEVGEEGLFSENVQIQETLETQKALQDAQVDLQEDQMVKAEMGL